MKHHRRYHRIRAAVGSRCQYHHDQQRWHPCTGPLPTTAQFVPLCQMTKESKKSTPEKILCPTTAAEAKLQHFRRHRSTSEEGASTTRCGRGMFNTLAVYMQPCLPAFSDARLHVGAVFTTSRVIFSVIYTYTFLFMFAVFCCPFLSLSCR